MQHLIFIFVLAVLYSCGNNDSKNKKPYSANQEKSNLPLTDSIHTFEYQTDFTDKNIINTSDRKIDLLLNGIENYFGGKKSSIVRFISECMGCLPIQVHQGGLLFGKRLLITPHNIKYHENNFDIPDSINRVSIFSDGRERANPKFNFQNGRGSIEYTGVSCNDADFNSVRLIFPSGNIVIDSLINASFFEYDLDTDGTKEQFLLGSRNCSQELVILRIRK